jgi:putative FmdB family regulatory protein
MPLYEYRCADCGTRFEILQRLGETAAGLCCPHCGKSRLAKQFSTFSASSTGAASEPACQTSPGGGCGAGFG